MPSAVCSVDVGTTSARAGIFDLSGAMLGRAEAPIGLRRTGEFQAEYASDDVWRAVCLAVREAVAKSSISADDVRGIAFAGTCSLVVLPKNGEPLSIASDGSAGWDTFAWFDHRASGEAAEISGTGHDCLSVVGGVMSPEMQLPRLIWLKRHLPDVWQKTGAMIDLADHLAMRASGSRSRSICTLTSKWPYRAGRAEAWPVDLFRQFGIADAVERAGLPQEAAPVGSFLGNLRPESADELGLTTNCTVAAGQVDAFAGALAVLGGLPPERLAREAALIGGTSSCLMFTSPDARTLPSVWGPFPDASLPGMWMNEAGQTSAGSLLDFVIRLFNHEPSIKTHRAIIDRVVALRSADPEFGSRLHVLPNFRGERFPDSDPSALGVISGLSLDTSFDGMCRLYWRTCVALVLGIRHIVDALRERGRPIDTLHIAGGHARHALLLELYADASNCQIVTREETEPMLLGSAMVAATGAGVFADMQGAVSAMWRPGRVLAANPQRRAQYDREFLIFKEMARQRRDIEMLSRP